eukprot:TRINITY_DN648_c0_g2_i3.p1 TRINITY_DN648_c0_g2~~TRINITY_DN648_c0_g2_i3.p1  ORF type:complete len:244 (-),score=77.79 TRINITY_DN648_c0_g2_i3:47-736(-)
MSLNPKDEQAFNNLCAKPYKDQAVWFLNAYWKKFGEKEATNVFDYYHKCIELDEKKAAGNQLDELNAHRFLEKVDKTLTVVSLRDKLNKAGIDKNAKRKFVPLTHFLVIHYNVNPSELANAPQGDNQEEVERAQKLLEQVQHAFSEAQRTAELSHKAEVAAKQAQAELEAAKAELQAQEATRKLAEAEAYLEEVKSRPGSAAGALWWIERELHEAKKYLPKSKGGLERK